MSESLSTFSFYNIQKLHCYCIHRLQPSFSLALAISYITASSLRSGTCGFYNKFSFSSLSLLFKLSWILMYVSSHGLRSHLSHKCSPTKPTSLVRLSLIIPAVSAPHRLSTPSIWQRSLLLAALVMLLIWLLPHWTQQPLRTTALTPLPLDRLLPPRLEQVFVLLPHLSRPLDRLLARPMIRRLVLLPLHSPPRATVSPLFRQFLRLVPRLQTPKSLSHPSPITNLSPTMPCMKRHSMPSKPW